MKGKTYMVLLVDRKQANMFSLLDGTVQEKKTLIDDQVPRKVKHGEEMWDAQDKIFRHIEEHLHRHLMLVCQQAAQFARDNNIHELIIGGHKPLFSKIEKHLPYPLCHYVKGKFVTELKAPFNKILNRAEECIAQLEAN
jgi:hypothetical protein